MTLDDTRKAIEVLLYCGNPGEDNGIGDTLALASLRDLEVFETASIARQQVMRDRNGEDGVFSEDDYEHDCMEAAYRLIESSKTLRREWFGAS